jgi:hypothetical protein
MPRKVISDSVALIARGLVKSGHVNASILARALGVKPCSLSHAIYKRKGISQVHEVLATSIAQACREHEHGSLLAAAKALRAAADRLDAQASKLAQP